VQGYKEIKGNETADQLVRKGSLHSFIGTEPACGYSERVARCAIRDWVGREHQNTGSPLQGKDTHIFMPSVKRNAKFLKLNRIQARQVTGLLTAHCHLKEHLHKLGIAVSPICGRCHNEIQTASHILCDCEALAELIFHH
jgi:hypothetical protein